MQPTIAAIIASTKRQLDDPSDESRTELDSHANMAVVGRHAYVIARSGRSVDVSPFTPEYQPLTAELVDAAVAYTDPYTGQVYILVLRNAIAMESMVNNLIPPFMMREAGIVCNDIPKIHVSDPSEEDHAIIFKETGLRIPLSLWGTFSYFITTKPTHEMLLNPEEVYMLTPTHWNPHSDAYAYNEESMLDWEGNIKEKRLREHRVVLDDIPDDVMMASALHVGLVEQQAVDNTFNDDDILEPTDKPQDELTLYDLMKEQADVSMFKMNIGSTNVSKVNVNTLLDVEDADDSQADTDDDNATLSEVESDYLEDDLDVFFQASSTTAGRVRGVDPAHLSKVWRISHEDAKRTLDNTSQHSLRSDDTTLSRNYGTGDRMLRYKRIHTYFFMDTFFASKKKGKSSRGHTCCQIFVTDKGFIYVVPMRRRSDVMSAVKQFAKEVGAPDALVFDMSGEQTSNELRNFCNDIGTSMRALEEGTPWSNKAELYIGLIKEAVRKDMREADSPLVFWDYCVERRARINNLTAKDRFNLHGLTPYTQTFGEEGNISNLCTYKWYEWCYYREQTAAFPANKEVLGRVLGPARGEGNEMCQWILKANGKVVPRRSMRPLTIAEIHSPIELKRQQVFNELIERRWGTSINPPKPQAEDDEHEFENYEDDDEPMKHVPDIEDIVDSNNNLIEQQPVYDKLINAEVMLQQGEESVMCTVKQRTMGPDGCIHGTYDDNPYMNTIIYDVEFPDGQVKEYSANLIAENILSQVDMDGYSYSLMESIVDYKKDEAVAIPLSEKYVTSKNGRRRLRFTTAGWKLLVRWKDGSEAWVGLKDMKEAHPVETAEFAKSRGIENEPAFAWWVPYTLRKRDVILSAVKMRVRRTTHKYGVEIPRDVEHAMRLDKANGNTMWMDALAKEMFNVGVAFEILEEGVNAPTGWSRVTGHLIWDVKMDFTRKARWVLDGHKTHDPVGSTYAGVVSRESVRIAFTYAALNEVDVCAADIRNAYLQAPSSQKDYIICGPEFGLENVGKVALIHRALYGGKAAGRDFRNHLRSCMHFLNFKSCPADPDVWMRPAIKSDSSTYYEFVLLYTDDALVISENATSILHNEIGRYFELKKESVGPPKIYLGGRVRKVQLENGVWAWSFSSSQYVQAAVKNVEEWLSKEENNVWKLPKKADTPIQTSYRPELDVSAELDPVLASYFQSLIGILRWIVELGRVDVCLEVSMMSSCLALPRVGHLQQVLHIFSYLKAHHNAELVYDPSDPAIDVAKFERRDWTSSEFGHVDGKEEIPSNMPEPRGKGFVIHAKVDADHASDTVSRRSRTGIFVWINCSLIHWWSKKQNSVESSSFGSEFTAMKQCCEYLRGLRYKLRMMGIPVYEPAYISGDNQSVLANTTNPDSTLKKKSQSIAYHFVREGVARGEWRTSYVNTHDNEADLLTKTLPSGEKRRGFVRNLLHHIFG
jgi:Reverse transcriptase (RNA-dependent DNA polymerase)